MLAGRLSLQAGGRVHWPAAGSALQVQGQDSGGSGSDRARYGMTASATQIRRHPPPRRLATLLLTVVHLESKAIDDALELLDLLMATELLGKAERDSDKDKVRRHPRLARASAKLAVAV